MKKRQLVAMVLAAVMPTGRGGGSAAPDATRAVGSGTSAAADTGKGEADSQKAKSGKIVTIILVESLINPERTAILREVADKYQAEHSNITIDIIPSPLESTGARIIQMLMNDSDADIVEVHDSTVAQYAANEWIIDLQKHIDAWDEKDTLTESVDKVIHYLRGGAYLTPYGFRQRRLFYRVDWFEEKGLDQPEIWQDVYDADLVITGPANSRFGYSSRGDPNGHQYANIIYWDWIGTNKMADPNAAYFLKGGDGAAISILPEVKGALHLYKGLFKNTCPMDSIVWGLSKMVQGFVGGTTAMLIQDPEVIVIYSADIQDDQWTLVPFLRGPSDQTVFPNGFAGWGIASSTEYPGETVDFLLYSSNSENNTYFAKNCSTIPTHDNVVGKNLYSLEGHFAMYMGMVKEPDVYRHVAYSQTYKAFATYKIEVDIMYQRYLTDEITDDELLRQLDEFWTRVYKDEDQKR